MSESFVCKKHGISDCEICDLRSKIDGYKFNEVNLQETIISLLEDLKKAEIYIQQLRGALGYSVSGEIKENPDIKNGIAEALNVQLEEVKMERKQLLEIHSKYHVSLGGITIYDVIEKLEAENAALKAKLERVREWAKEWMEEPVLNELDEIIGKP